MKKSMLALAALTAFAGAATAQSSVTLFGIVDAGVARLSVKQAGGSKNITGMTHSGLASSRLGFRGVEDLGGGLQAGFWIEGQLTNDDGTAGGQTWQRRSTVSLMGGFGEIRLGRDYSANFWNTTIYDPFGTNGVGSTNAITQCTSLAGTNCGADVRVNNSISYFTPAMGGASVQVQYSFGENVGGGLKTNNYLGVRAGYAAGPISAHVAYGKMEGATDAADAKYLNVGASFDAGMIKPMLIVAQVKNGAGAQILAIQPGVLVNVGAGTIRAAISRYDIKNSNNDWNKLAVGYVHNLSKRTAVYTTLAFVKNKGSQNKSANTTGGIPALSPDGGMNANGLEFGVRHAF